MFVLLFSDQQGSLQVASSHTVIATNFHFPAPFKAQSILAAIFRHFRSPWRTCLGNGRGGIPCNGESSFQQYRRFVYPNGLGKWRFRFSIPIFGRSNFATCPIKKCFLVLLQIVPKTQKGIATKPCLVLMMSSSSPMIGGRKMLSGKDMLAVHGCLLLLPVRVKIQKGRLRQCVGMLHICVVVSIDVRIYLPVLSRWLCFWLRSRPNFSSKVAAGFLAMAPALKHNKHATYDPTLYTTPFYPHPQLLILKSLCLHQYNSPLSLPSQRCHAFARRKMPLPSQLGPLSASKEPSKSPPRRQWWTNSARHGSRACSMRSSATLHTTKQEYKS